MKLHIDTAPVWEAYRQDCECPLCLLRQRVETSAVDYFLGESVMEPDQRIEVNQRGFCARHFRQMYDAGNRLGLALMTHTHMKETLHTLRDNARKLKDAAASEAGRSGIARVLGRKASGLQELAAPWGDPGRDCVFCKRVAESMERYIYTILYLYDHDAAFAKCFAESKGMCLEHYGATLAMAAERVHGKAQAGFVNALADAELAAFERLEGEIEWFTLKFDYRNDDKPWGTSRDAVKRSINKLRTHVIDD